MSAGKPVEGNTRYFRTERGYRELGPDTPARVIEGGGPHALLYLQNAEEGQTVEVYVDGTWLKGERVAPPKEYIFEVSVITFDENEHRAGKALHTALQRIRDERDTPMPWVKLITPDKRVGK